MSDSYSLWKKRDWYYCGIMVERKQRKFSLMTKMKKEAEKKAKSIYEELKGKKLTDILNYYLQADSNRSYNTNRYAEIFMNEFISWFGKDMSASLITKQHLTSYDNYLKNVCINNPTSRKIKLVALKAIFNLAWKDCLIENRPFRGFKIQRPKPKTDYLNSLEVYKLLKAAEDNPLCQGYIKFLLYTGCRGGELRQLKWSEIKTYGKS